MRTKPRTTGKTAPARPRAATPARGPRFPRGYGAMRDVPLDLDPRIDLTQPIYEQAVALGTGAPKGDEKEPR